MRFIRLVLSILFPILAVALPFQDVSQDAYYADAVQWAYEVGITNGVDATHFDPDRPITRAEMVTMLWRMHGSPDVGKIPVPVGEEVIYDGPPSYVGRLYIEREKGEPFSVGIYDGMGQNIVDREDSACQYIKNHTMYIGDHNSQGFWLLTSRSLGKRCYIVRPSGYTEVYELQKIDKNGQNLRYDEITSEGVSIWDTDYDLVLATCNDGEGVSVTITFWNCISIEPPKNGTNIIDPDPTPEPTPKPTTLADLTYFPPEPNPTIQPEYESCYYGRMSIGDIYSVGLYDTLDQELVDMSDAGFIMKRAGGCYMIGDHDSEGLWIIRWCGPGDTLKITKKDGTVEEYTWERTDRHGSNIGYDILDDNGNSCFTEGYDLFIATCNDSTGVEVTVTFWNLIKK